MAGKASGKMPPSARAKQFMPFSAVAGLEIALAEKYHQREMIGRPVLPEEKMREIDEALRSLDPGDPVEVSYFLEEDAAGRGSIRRIRGRFRRVDEPAGMLLLESEDAAGGRMQEREDAAGGGGSCQAGGRIQKPAEAAVAVAVKDIQGIRKH